MKVFCMDGYDAGMVTDAISRALGIPIEIVNSPEEADSTAPMVYLGWEVVARVGIFTTKELAQASSDWFEAFRLNEVINR